MVFLGFTVSVQAECKGVACSDVTVDPLLMLASETIIVGTSGDESKLQCESHGGRSLIMSNSTGKNVMYSALLTAQTTEKTLSIRLNDTSSNVLLRIL